MRGWLFIALRGDYDAIEALPEPEPVRRDARHSPPDYLGEFDGMPPGAGRRQVVL